MVLLASSYDQSKYFKAADLETERKLRIKSVTEEEIGIGAEKDQKLVVWFTNDKRGLVLNRINNRTIRSAYGDAVEGWIGKIIVVFPTQADFRGKMGPALRVRIPPPKQAAGNGGQVAAKPKPPVDDELDDDKPPAKPQPAAALADDLDDEIDF